MRSRTATLQAAQQSLHRLLALMRHQAKQQRRLAAQVLQGQAQQQRPAQQQLASVKRKAVACGALALQRSRQHPPSLRLAVARQGRLSASMPAARGRLHRVPQQLAARAWGPSSLRSRAPQAQPRGLHRQLRLLHPASTSVPARRLCLAGLLRAAARLLCPVPLPAGQLLVQPLRRLSSMQARRQHQMHSQRLQQALVLPPQQRCRSLGRSSIWAQLLASSQPQAMLRRPASCRPQRLPLAHPAQLQAPRAPICSPCAPWAALRRPVGCRPPAVGSCTHSRQPAPCLALQAAVRLVARTRLRLLPALARRAQQAAL